MHSHELFLQTNASLLHWYQNSFKCSFINARKRWNAWHQVELFSIQSHSSLNYYRLQAICLGIISGQYISLSFLWISALEQPHAPIYTTKHFSLRPLSMIPKRVFSSLPRNAQHIRSFSWQCASTIGSIQILCHTLLS